MKDRLVLVVMLAASLALASAVLPSCKSAEVPKKLDLTGVEITVWDALQPEFPGSPDYSEEASRVIREFCRETGVKVALKQAERREVMEVLSGETALTAPHLMFSCEWPVVSDILADVSGAVDVTAYVDPAASYWSRGDRLLGIPAYIQWIGAATRALGSDVARTAYWVESPAFFRAVLDRPDAGWSEDSLLKYVKWVKEEYGPFADDPIMLWQHGEAAALFPVTPYLFKWLRASSEDAAVSAAPLSSPFGGESFYYTVPAYLVLTEDSREKAAATELGKRLAANLGRWAARTLGCIPAQVSDMPIFNLESGFEYSQRQMIWESVRGRTLAVPDASDYLQTASIDGVLRVPVADYLRGETSVESLQESIRGACLRQTKP